MCNSKIEYPNTQFLFQLLEEGNMAKAKIGFKKWKAVVTPLEEGDIWSFFYCV